MKVKRIHFQSSDLETTRKIDNELLLSRVENRHTHVLAKRETLLVKVIAEILSGTMFGGGTLLAIVGACLVGQPPRMDFEGNPISHVGLKTIIFHEMVTAKSRIREPIHE